MKESVGYTVTLNIVIVFIVIVFAFLAATLVYFKSNKVSNIITETIEKYEGYNSYAKSEITQKLKSIGYNKKKLNSCGYISGCTLQYHGNDGYCVYLCDEIQRNNDKCEVYYYYRIKTNMLLNVPIINRLLEIPIYSNTNRLYNFEDQSACGG